MTQTIERRAEELFREHRQENFQQTDRLFAVLMVFQWMLGITVAYWNPPPSWSQATGQTDLHIWTAVLLGGAIAALPILLAIKYPGAALTRQVIAVSQLLFSVLLIHLSGGRIETHFHVFGSLAFLAFYYDWRVLVTATVIVAANQITQGIVWSHSIYDGLAVSPWQTLEHVAWAVFEDFFLIWFCRQNIKGMREGALRRAQLETANEQIEIAASKSRLKDVFTPTIDPMQTPTEQTGQPYQDQEAIQALPSIETTEASSSETASCSETASLRILVVEDNLINQKVIVRYLEKQGHHISLANNGEEGLQALTAESFDIVLMDIQMPRIDGLEATRILRERERGTSEHMPVIAVTAHTAQVDRDRCFEAGMDAFLPKPIRSGELFELIDSVLEANGHNRQQASLVDFDMLITEFGGDRGFLEECVQLFFEESRSLLSSVEDAVDSRDDHELHYAAHALKGTLRQFTNKYPTLIAQEIEDMGSAGETADAEQKLIELKVAMDQLVGELRDFSSEPMTSRTLPLV